MKKILKLLGITSLIMLVLCGVAAFFVYKNYNNEQEAQKKSEQEELDIRVYGLPKEKIEDETVIPLYLSGENKNVETFSFANEKEIYNVGNSKKVKERLEELKRKSRVKYSLEEPLWAYNPYGTNELSLYLYCELKEAATLKYTIHLEDEDVPDFTRTARVAPSLEGTKILECQILGLIPDQENFIILKLYNVKGEEIKRIIYSITPNPIKGDIRPMLLTTKGKSQEQISNGLYFFLGHDVENSNVKEKIYLYDNSGLLRGAIPVVGKSTDNILFLNGNMLYNYSDHEFAEVNEMGQVVKIHTLEGYKIDNDFTYDGFGHLIIIGSKNNANSIEDRIVSLDVNSGKVISLIDMETLFKKIKKAAKKEKGKEALDWIGLNSIVWAGDNSVIVNARELSGIIKIDNVSSVKPSLRYIIGDKKLWKELGKTNKILNKVLPEDADPESIYFEEPFSDAYGQSSLILNKEGTAAGGQYYISFYNNNYGYIPTRKEIDWSAYKGVGTKGKKANTSYYYKYYIDETEGTYDLVKSFEIPYSTYESSIQEYGSHIIVNSGTDCSVGEYDKDGKLIQALKYNAETYTCKVIKMDLKDFWFK